MTDDPNTGVDRASAREERTCCVVGGDPIGEVVVRRLQADGDDIRVVGEPVGSSVSPEYEGDPTDVGLLDDAGVGEASTVVVATSSDRRNLLIAQLVRARFDAPRTVVLVNDPARRSAIEAAGHEPVCVSSTLSEAVLDAV